MPGFEFCLPTTGKAVPAGADWLHEVKYDGYRLRVERDGDRVRLFSRNGYDWTGRYPWIVEAARMIRQKRFVLDGEAVILGLHSRQQDEEVQSCPWGALRPPPHPLLSARSRPRHRVQALVDLIVRKFPDLKAQPVHRLPQFLGGQNVIVERARCGDVSRDQLPQLGLRSAPDCCLFPLCLECRAAT
jgi:hypothetical protein